MYKEYALNEIIIKGLADSIRHSIRQYWENKKDGNLHDLMFHAKCLEILQGHDIKSKQTKLIGPEPQNQREKPWSSQKLDINAVRNGSTSSPSASMRNNSGTPVVAMSHNATHSSPASLNILLFLIKNLENL